MAERIYIFKAFERFWHWSQAALIMFLMLTGFEIHGSYSFFGFEKAVGYHGVAAWSLIGLWIFAIFWHLTSGEWRHYIPTSEKLLLVARYYSSGIFRHEPHPFRPTLLNKHNPLQRLTYLGVLLFVSPLIWITGLLYLFHGDWTAWGLNGLRLEWVATGHTVGAFLMLAFLTSHLYLATTGHTPMAHVKSMITGWHDGDEEDQNK
jgi:thiosulfate reductase cytochrome b subunit